MKLNAIVKKRRKKRATVIQRKIRKVSKMKQRRLKVIALHGAIEKILIL